MKITKSQLKQIIKEELEFALNEYKLAGLEETIKDVVDEAFRIWGGERTEEAEEIAFEIAKDLVPKAPDKTDVIASVIASHLCKRISGLSQRECSERFITGGR